MAALNQVPGDPAKRRVLGILLSRQVREAYAEFITPKPGTGVPKEKKERLLKQARGMVETNTNLDKEHLKAIVAANLYENNVPTEAVKRVLVWSTGRIEVQFFPFVRRIK